MSRFDEGPEDLHGECAAEIHRLEAEVAKPVAYIHDGGEGRLWWCKSVDADGKYKKDDVELFTAEQIQAAYEAELLDMLERAIAKLQTCEESLTHKDVFRALKELLK